MKIHELDPEMQVKEHCGVTMIQVLYNRVTVIVLYSKVNGIQMGKSRRFFRHGGCKKILPPQYSTK